MTASLWACWCSFVQHNWRCPNSAEQWRESIRSLRNWRDSAEKWRESIRSRRNWREEDDDDNEPHVVPIEHVPEPHEIVRTDMGCVTQGRIFGSCTARSQRAFKAPDSTSVLAHGAIQRVGFRTSHRCCWQPILQGACPSVYLI
mmetsp:Transcript_32912/g.86085  ORF Transcript_32912/g.86085 Transcript_32912/m.86085 type:complete len:144 (-) Transcript_32912:88-519(-)